MCIMAECFIVAAGISLDKDLEMDAGDRIFFELDDAPGRSFHTVKVAPETHPSTVFVVHNRRCSGRHRYGSVPGKGPAILASQSKPYRDFEATQE